METSIGFTGTRDGMSKDQVRLVRKILERYRGTNFHHGDCVGADAQAHDMASDLNYSIWIHPGDNDLKRAHKRSHYIYQVKSSLHRNKDIVNSSQLLIATPKGPEMRRSGTWFTIRYARKQLRTTVIIYPDGNYHWSVHE